MATTSSEGSATKETAAKKSPAEKTAKKTTANRASKRASAPRAAAAKRATASQVAAQAAQQLIELTGKGVEGVTGLERTDDGWKVHVEVVEVRRIPDTTDILALYEVQVDEDGDLIGYRRLRRYARGVPGDD
jgi:Gas vesicle synthesis protein GvpO